MNGWKGWGGGYQQPTITTLGPFCSISGLIKRRGGIKNPHLTTLPPNCRPNKRLIFNVNNNEGTLRVDVQRNGQVRYVAGTYKHKWMNLDGIFFATKNQRRIGGLNGWKNYGGSYGAVSYTLGGRAKVCEVEGLMKGKKWGRPMITLPSSCRPTKRLIFNLNNHAATARVDVLPTGQVVWIAGGKTHNWLSLSGISFVKSSPPALALVNRWTNYNGAYKTVTASKIGHLCFVSGLVRSGLWGKPVLTLPAKCRPAGRLIFNVNNNERTARVDVLPNGQVVWVAGGMKHGWLSLTGIVIPLAKSA